MKRSCLLVVISAVLFTLVNVPEVNATLLWEWNFSTESGTFQTTGNLSDISGPAVFDFIEGSFNVSSSGGGIVQQADPTSLNYIGTSSASPTLFVPGSLIWDGSNVSSINWDFNAVYTAPGRPYIYTLTTSAGKLREWRGSSLGFREVVSGTTNILLVPEPISSILFIAGGMLLAGRRFTKKKKKA